MKIKILQPVNLDLGDGLKLYLSNSCKPGKCKTIKYIHEIDDEFAIKENLVSRYKEYPEHIEILEYPKKKNKNKNKD